MKKLLMSVGLCCFTTAAFAQENPQPGYKDSYAVDGVCYCDSNFDHGIENVTISTPVGNRTVRQVCDDIRDVLGTGRSSGRALYNDIQCGNGPANNAGDEDPGRCPGRVDIGPDGCDDIGPRWDLDAVYLNDSTSPNPEPDPAPPPAPPIDANGTSASHNSNAAGFAVDGNNGTRWTSETVQRSGMWFQLDLGNSQTVGSVTLDSSQSPNDEPATYTLSTSTDGSSFSNAASGSGSSNGVTTIEFSNRSARYIRITQNGSKTRNWWSIHEMSVSESSGGGNNDDDNDNDNDNDNGNSVDLNGDFRDGLSGWTIEDGHIDLSGRGHDDDISARLRSSDARLTRTVSVLRNTNYRLRGRIETNGRFGFEMGGNRTSSTAAGSARDFKRRTFEFNTGNNDSIEIFAEYRNETGRFDNITLENLD